MDRQSGAVDARIRHHFEVFGGLLQASEDFGERREFVAAAAYAQMAAHYAYWNHGGLWASSRLEAVLAKVGRTLPVGRESNSVARPGRNETPRRILHVMTAAYAIGGHTRMIWRWIQQDRGRSHSLIITQQGSAPVPSQLIRAVNDSGGRVHFADNKIGGVLSWARLLREIALQYDQLVLHVHPHDVVPIIAFSQKDGRPPLIYVNHADHVFWLGVSISDVVAHLRESSLQISTARRGIQGERCAIIPVPLNHIARTMSRTEAKRQLGLPEDATVLFSIADAYKFEPILGETSFVDALLPVLRSYQNTWLVVVGPDNAGQWKNASRESHGRIRTYGRRSDGAAFYQAADIYLDPFPFASTTSFLEAGSYELPLVSFCPFGGEARVLGGDSPELTETIVRTKSLAQYRAEIGKLIENRDLRLQLGEKTQRFILGAHVGEGWVQSLDRLHARAAKVLPAGIYMRPDVPHVNLIDVRLACISDGLHMSRDINAVVRDEVGLLPPFQRLKLWIDGPNRHLNLLPRFLLSDWTRTRLRHLISGKRRKISQEALIE